MHTEKEKLNNMVKTIFFLLVFFSIVLVLNKMHLKYTLENQPLLRKEAMYQEYIVSLPKKEINYAFFGDSKTDYAINPEYIKSSYNFSSREENYVKTYFKFKKIIEIDKIKINNAIFEIDMHTFSTNWAMENNLFDELYYYSKFTPISEISSIKKESMPSVWIEATFPSFGRGVDFKHIWQKPDLTEIHLGWTKNTDNLSTPDKNKDTVATYNDHFGGAERISPVTFDYFGKSLKLAKENAINIFLIMYPISPEYDKELTKHGITRDEYYQAIFDKTTSILGKDFVVLDYHDLFWNQEEYLADTSHLNYIGAEVFSKKVFKDLITFKK